VRYCWTGRVGLEILATRLVTEEYLRAARINSLTDFRQLFIHDGCFMDK
jgi:hypothetical protein